MLQFHKARDQARDFINFDINEAIEYRDKSGQSKMGVIYGDVDDITDTKRVACMRKHGFDETFQLSCYELTDLVEEVDRRDVIKNVILLYASELDNGLGITGNFCAVAFQLQHVINFIATQSDKTTAVIYKSTFPLPVKVLSFKR